MQDGAGAAPPPPDRRRFERTLAELAARREAAAATVRRMREAVERSRGLLRETAEVLGRIRPASRGSGGDGGPPGDERGGS